MQANPRPTELVSTAGYGAATSLLIAGLTFSHLLIPVLTVLVVGDLLLVLVAALCLLAIGLARGR